MLIVTYTARHLHYITHGLVLTLDLFLFGMKKKEECEGVRGRKDKGKERGRMEGKGIKAS